HSLRCITLVLLHYRSQVLISKYIRCFLENLGMNHVFLSTCPTSNHPPIQLFVLILSLLESTCISCKSSILTILRMLSIVLWCLVRVSCYRCSFFVFSQYTCLFIFIYIGS